VDVPSFTRASFYPKKVDKHRPRTYTVDIVKQKRVHTMAQAIVIHGAFEDTPRTVAMVEVGERTGSDALEYAYRRTQNIEGSWSKGPVIEWEGQEHDNGDYSEDITVMQPLHVSEGKTYGLRSTSVGDHILFGAVKYKVDSFGFSEL
jgi:hypothetical protein